MNPSYDFANILLSGPCNLHCPYCIGREIDPRFNRDTLDLFPPRNLGRFAALLHRHAVRQVVLTGTNTDPQLYRHEARLIAWLREQLPGAQLSLHTNGRLAVRKMDVLNQYDRVSLSFPSFDPDTYEQMTGSRRVPDLERILRGARVPVKISCVLDEHNAGGVDDFLARCRALGIRRVVLRQLYGDTRSWDILPGQQPVRTYRNNPVYDVDGMEVTYWRFEDTTSTSLNLFSDGTISTAYLLTRPASPNGTRIHTDITDFRNYSAGAPPVSEPAPIYTSMRNQILSLVPAEAGIVPSLDAPHVWGVLTEMGFPNGVATLVALADGTTSMYFSGGGGIIGSGGHAAVAAVSRALVAEAEQHLGALVSTDGFPLPTAGRVRFYVLTWDRGALTAEAGREELVAGRHALAGLFRRADDVVTQVRLHSQQQR